MASVLVRMLGSALFYIPGILAETCLVYTYGSYTHKDCKQCCGSGIHRKCCLDTPEEHNNPGSLIGIVFGCLLSLLFIAGVCGALSKFCSKLRPSSSRRTTSTSTPNPPPYMASLDSRGLQDTYPKPPAYTAWTPPPPYDSCDNQAGHCTESHHQSRTQDGSNTGHANRSGCDIECIAPPPYTP